MKSESDVPGAGFAAAAGLDRAPRATLPGPVTYAVIAVWAALVAVGVGTGLLEGGRASRLLLPAAVVLPVAAVGIAYRVSSAFRSYLLTIDLRLVLGAQLWRVIGIAFLFGLALDELPAGFAVPAGLGDIATGIAAMPVVLSLTNGTLTRGQLYAFTTLGVADFLTAFVTGLTIEPSALNTLPFALFPTLAVPFFGILHLVAVLQSRHRWGERVQHYAIRGDSGMLPA